MASSLLALLDDIATLLDDVAVMTKVAARQGIAAADDVAVLSKVAAKKTAGVLGDDLALNAEQVTGVKADRELPVVWAVFKGSMLNKAILVPAALLISAFVPWLITPLLMLGGVFLCFEGAEKLLHKFFHSKAEDEAERAERLLAVSDTSVDMVAFEKEKIKGAVRTDFILSAEIIVITLGTVATASFGLRVAVLVTVALAITLGVYGLVAGIVKIDDAGLYLSRQAAAWKQAIGRGLLVFAPWMMKALSVVGTAAMFLVGGGILSHSLPFLHHASTALTSAVGDGLAWITPTLFDAVVGLAAGALAVVLVKAVTAVLPKKIAPKTI